MKKHVPPRGRNLPVAACLGGVFCCVSQIADALSDTWSPAPGSANWIPAAGQMNWSLGPNVFPGSTSATSNGETCTFAGSSTQTGIVINSPLLSLGGLDFGNAAAADSSYTIGSNGGSPMLFGSGGAIRNDSLSPASAKVVSYTVAAPMVIGNSTGTALGGGSYTYDFSGGSTSAAQESFLKFTGAISGSASMGNTTLLTLIGNNNIRLIASNDINSIEGIISDGLNGGTLSLALTTPSGNANTTILISGNNSFSGGTTLTRGSGAFEGSTLRLAHSSALGTGPVSWLAASGTSTIQQAAGSSLALINAVVVAGGQNATFDTNGGAMSLNGVISGAGGLTKNGSGTLILGNVANTYSAATQVNAGAVRVALIGNVGSLTSNLGQNSTIHLGNAGSGGTLIYMGTGETSDRVIDLSGTTGGATLQSDGTGAVVLTTSPILTGVGNKTLVLQGANAGDNSMGGSISDSAGSVTSVAKMQAGTWCLTGSSGYSGTTSVTGGTLIASAPVRAFGTNPSGISIGGSGALSLRSDTSVSFTNGTIPYNLTTTGNGATLNVNQKTAAGTGQTITVGNLGITSSAGSVTTNFTGSNNTSLNIGAVTDVAATSGTETILNSISGGGSLTLAAFTSARTGTPTLTFSGNGTTIVSGVIAQNGTNAMSLMKSGVGMLILNAADLFSGNTSIVGGTLRLGNPAALGTGSVSLAGGTLDLNGFTTPNKITSLAGILSNSGAAVDLSGLNSGSSVLNGLSNGGNSLAVTGSGDITLGTVSGAVGLSLAKSGSNTLIMAGNADNSFMSITMSGGTLILNKFTLGHVAKTITIESGTVKYGTQTVGILDGTGQIGAVIMTGGVLDMNGASGDNATIGNLNGTGGVITNSNLAAATLTIGGNNGSGGDFQGTIQDGVGILQIIKTGSGTIDLSGDNAYTGNTTVTEGTLTLKSAYLANSSTVSVAAGAFLNLDYAGKDVVASLTLGGLALPDGTYGSGNSGGRITGTGKIQVGAVSNFSTWANSNGIVGQPAAGDFDHDGITNLVEYGLGLNPTIPNLPSGTYSGGVISFSKNAEAVANGDITYEIEQSTTLDGWSVVTPGENDGTIISFTLPSGQPRKFARLKITKVP
ncbi:MAG: autotransporter-associated beta strand repeat-containing protein [Luteolibacter sp.]